jgi:ADP-heptose:LPS heptosyltransferase
MSQKNILIIQTAFIGDTLLATSLISKTKELYPEHRIHFLLRKGNENLVKNNSKIDKLWVWDKSGFKYLKLFKLAFVMRNYKFDYVFNIHRHASSGIVTALMKATHKIGFLQNPLSFFFTQKIEHKIPHYEEGANLHEVQRNLQLIKAVNPKVDIFEKRRPELFFSDEDQKKIAEYKVDNYVVIVPASVWYTKQWHESKWIELCEKLMEKNTLYFLGGPGDLEFCQKIINKVGKGVNLCGKVSFLQSALLMKDARRVFVNDSSALHMASSVNAKTTVIFNSTIPQFGYDGLSDNLATIEAKRPECKPCGLHGHKECPLGHFKCAMNVDVGEVYLTLHQD